MNSGFQGIGILFSEVLVCFLGLDQCCTDVYSFLWIGFGLVFLGKDLVFRILDRIHRFVSMGLDSVFFGYGFQTGFLRFGLVVFPGLGLVFVGLGLVVFPGLGLVFLRFGFGLLGYWFGFLRIVWLS
jgi:hypothetical protein